MNKVKSLILLCSRNKVCKVKGKREVTEDQGQLNQPLLKSHKEPDSDIDVLCMWPWASVTLSVEWLIGQCFSKICMHPNNLEGFLKEKLISP